MAPRVLNLKTILVPVDFSAASEKALAYAIPLARQCGAKITLLHVSQVQFCATEFAYTPIEQTSIEGCVREQLESLASARLGPELRGGALVRHGMPFYEIAKAAEEIEADMIVINTRGYTGLKHALLGSTAERVLRYAPCPVLVVREGEREFVPG
jgi:nucleotide-binding universal stress UspA family protein